MVTGLSHRFELDELVGPSDMIEEVVEMANLTSTQTGVPGTIFISTAMGVHGPRVKYFLKPGRNQPSFSVSIADVPTVVTNSLSTRTGSHVRIHRTYNPTGPSLRQP